MKPIRWLVLPVLGAALLAGCETARVAGPEAIPANVDVAEKAEREGEHVIAAREYERLARTVKAPQTQNFQLRAADNLIRAGQLREARYQLEQINVAGLDTSFAARRQILQARILTAEGAHEKAIRLLGEAGAARALNPALQAEIHRVRAQAELALDNPIGAVRNLIQREQYIVGKDAITENQMQLWKILDSQPRARLKSEFNATNDPVLSGWIELALAAIEAGGSAGRLNVAIEGWKKTYPTHPAGEGLLNSLLSAAPGLTGRIDRIALLLPLTSNHAGAAQAVRDGFLAMDAANTDPDKPRIKVYDLGPDPARAPEVYALAVQEGAQLVVGPLGRDAADTIIRGTTLTVPTLLLNHTDIRPNGAGARHLFQFGLPPEQEARQAAERAYLDGHRQAVILFPKNAWGERMEAAFASHWQRLGGVVLASEAYIETDNDHSETIKRLLHISQSEARRELIARLAKQKIQFESRPRQDLDFIFLAADARRGRMIKPQLNFFHAARVPVYATSHIFTGKGDVLNDQDLDGVLFPDMPWMLVNDGKIQQLRERIQQNWPHAHSDLDRLYALGVDSYAILPHLNRISSEAAARFSGVTSGLSLDRGGRLQRQLVWAQFSKGVPKLVDTSARTRGQLEVESESTPGG
jgi:outer membrane PBP1 activator LpoA protein